jgi:hypothetical protein
MESDKEFTPVVFRAERSGKFKGDVTAVFPTISNDYAGLQMTCYAHVGQHSGCSWEWYYSTRAAKPEEYKDLLAELVSVGYRPKVCRRISRAHRDEFAAEMARQDAAVKRHA